MLTFLIYTLVLIGVGIFVRIFWIPLMILGSILVIGTGILVSAGITAIIFELFHFTFAKCEFNDTSNFFTYAVIFYTVLTFVYLGIISDIFNFAYKLLGRIRRPRKL